MKKNSTYFILLLLLIISCKKYTINEVVIVPWQTDIAFPLINSTFSVSDVFDLSEDTELEYIDEETGLLGISYSGKILSYDASEILEIADQELATLVNYPDPGLPLPINDTVYLSEVFTLDFETQDLNGVEANMLSMLSGSIDLTINSSIAYLSNVHIIIPHMKKNGVSYEFESDIEANNEITDSEDFEAYIMDLSQEDLGYNQLRIEYRLIISYDPATPPTGEELAISFQFNEPKLDYIIGYFGMNELASKTDSIKIKLFNNTIQGQFQFLDPFMYMRITNSFGMPTLIDVTEFKSVNQTTGEVTQLFLEGITDEPFEISYPTQIGDSTFQEFYFDNSNSNIEAILNDGDKYVIWALDASSNPNGPTENFNFLSHESKLEIDTKITIPLKGYAYDWVFSDTTRLDSKSDSPDEIDDVEEVNIRLILDNGFPAEGTVQIYTTDSLFNITDSLFVSPTAILESGTLVDGVIVESKRTITDVLLSEEKKDHFFNAKNLITRAMMQTTNGSSQETIQIYDYYTIGVIMGIRAKLNIDPDSL